MGSIIAIVSGLLMSIQGVFNTRITEKTGIWLANTTIHLIGLLTALIVLFFARDGHIQGLKSINKFYLLSGVMGVGIVYSVIVAISKMGPAQATLFILVAQVIGAYCIELFGLFGTEKVDFNWIKILGLMLMISGIIVFKIKK